MEEDLPRTINNNFRIRLIMLGLIGVAVLALLGIYQSGIGAASYTIDDQSLINTPQLKNDNILSFLIHAFRFPEYHLDFYPLRDLSYWVDIHVFGAKFLPGESLTLFRLHNFFLFFLLGIFVYLFMIERELDNPVNRFLFFIWLIHPYHAELMLWVSARKDLLGLIFTISFFICYSKFWRTKKNRWIFLALLAGLFALLTKNILSLLLLGFGAVGLIFTARKTWRSKQQLLVAGLLHVLLHALLFFSGLAATIGSSYFYSTINDMRFAYTVNYRISASLAALGRMSWGWVYPPVNSIDVFNWGDWAHRNQEFIPVGIFVLGSLLWGLLWSWKKRDRSLAFFILLFLASYLPISGLAFPHRNFYSVRYFEFPSLILLFLAMTRLQKLTITPHQALRRIFSVALIGIFGMQFLESKYWRSPEAVIHKAIMRDSDNPSLLAQLDLFSPLKGSGLTCRPEEIGPNGSLSWYPMISRNNLFDDRSGVFEQWLREHSKRHSRHFNEITEFQFDLAALLRGNSQKHLDFTQIPEGFLAYPYHRLLLMAGLCLANETQRLNKWKEIFYSHFLADPIMIHNFSLRAESSVQGQLLRCFPIDIRKAFTNQKWKSAVQKQLSNPLFSWWLGSLQAGASGVRNGCGFSNANGYDCGSTMDQAAMIQLYIELYNKTAEPGFLSEALLFAENGNQMCALRGEVSRPCGDGKAQGTWILALLKMILVNPDFDLRNHLLKQLALLPSQLTLNDEWDFFEIYRSYYLGFLVFPESRQQTFFEKWESLALTQKIVSKDQAQHYQILFKCVYHGECPSTSQSTKRILKTRSLQVSASLQELVNSSEKTKNHFEVHLENANKKADLPINIGRISMASCQGNAMTNNFDLEEFNRYLENYQAGKFNEYPKPFFYSNEGDNFAPLLLATFNVFFAPVFGCAHWEILGEPLTPLQRFTSVNREKSPTQKRRPLFLLSQLLDGNRSLRLWMVNNTEKTMSLVPRGDCPFLHGPKTITITPFQSGEYYLNLKNNFQWIDLTHCAFEDRDHRLYPVHP